MNVIIIYTIQIFVLIHKIYITKAMDLCQNDHLQMHRNINLLCNLMRRQVVLCFTQNFKPGRLNSFISELQLLEVKDLHLLNICVTTKVI